MHNPAQDPTCCRLDRRAAIRWMMAAAALMPVMNHAALGQSGPSVPTPGGFGSDPNLGSPGDLPWQRSLTEGQLATLTELVDLILPRVGDSPSASELKVPDFFDEWVSAPYPNQKQDRVLVLSGLEWLDSEAKKRFGKTFKEISTEQQTAICDDICNPSTAKSEFKQASASFARIRDLTMGGYYTTEVGVREVGYVGNMPLPKYDAPPKEVLDRLGVEISPW
jgi:hypothetical protein